MKTRHARKLALLLALAPAASAQWTYETTVVSPDPDPDFDFAEDVDVWGDTMVLGTPHETGIYTGEGTAYVYRRSGASWVQETQLFSFEPYPDGGFGYAVAIDGDTVAVSQVDGGKVGIWTRTGTAWSIQAWLQTASFNATNIDLDGDTLVVGDGFVFPNNGGERVQVYVRDGASWILQQNLFSPVPGTNFGQSVAIHGDTLAVGHSEATVGGTIWSGSVHVYERSGTSWSLQDTLNTPGQSSSIYLGQSVGVWGDTVVAGAPLDKTVAGFDGAAWVWERTGTTWSAGTPLGAVNTFKLGGDVAVEGDTIIVGAGETKAMGLPMAGRTYVFGRTGSGWAQQQKLLPSAPEAGTSFGHSVALHDETLVIALPAVAGGNPPAQAESVEVYEFVSSVAYCTAGTSASGCQALLASTGLPSASLASGFTLSATGVEGAKDGLFFFGANGRQANPWGNGTSYQCVVPPVARAGLLLGTGTTGQCDGAFAQDLNARWCPSCPKPAQNPGAGTTVQAQLWYRDPLNTSNQTTSLSDAVEFVLAP